MNTSLGRIISYFHACYQSDNRELLIYDFLDRKVEDKIHMEGKEELINNDYPFKAIETEKAIKILKKLELFEKEKELLYGTFFICGSYVNFRGEKKRLCSPLFYYPAEIIQREEFYYIAIKADERRLNFPLINMLSQNSENDMLSDPLFKQISTDYITFDDIGSIAKLCRKYLSNINVDGIYHYPDNTTSTDLKGAIKKYASSENEEKVLVPTSIVGIVTKSSNTRGVLNELQDLSLSENFSLPLQELFLDVSHQRKTNTYKEVPIPMILSEAQRAILKSSATNPLTLIVGPPGTGKSYTIGAIAAEHVSRGESVLITSKTDEAVDVVAEKITSALDTDKGIVRGGKKREYATPLRRYIKAILTRASPVRYLIKAFGLSKSMDIQQLKEYHGELKSITRNRAERIENLEASLQKEVKNEISWGAHLSKEKEGFWDKLKTHYLSFKNKIQTPIWQTSQTLYQKDREQIADIKNLLHVSYILQLLEVLGQKWHLIKEFYEALKLSSDTERLNKFEQIDFTVILKAFPVWLCNLSEIKNVLPLQKEMFDVVIIDEATQCDIASCLPLIQRAKRVVFAGDPNQLRHISFLSKAIQNMLKTKHHLSQYDSTKLNYRDNSILDLVMSSLQSGDQVAMLDEHYRSIPPIISFSNHTFYQGELRIMTARPDEIEQGLYFTNCEGKRQKDGSNPIEADALINDIKALLLAEKDLDQEHCTSVGILSPFTRQAELLSKLIMQEISMADIEKHNIRVGTAYSFQGEERDNMYLSFVIDANTHHSAVNHINKEDVFNVSITRARNQQHVYLSIDSMHLKTGSILHAYLSSSTQKIENNRYELEPHHQTFIQKINDLLKSFELNSFWIGYSIAGLTVDILLKTNEGEYLAIDLVGYPDEYEDFFGIERYRILNRAGVKVFPLPYSDWYFERDTTVNQLKNFLQV